MRVENDDQSRWRLLRRGMDLPSWSAVIKHAGQRSRLRLIILVALALFLVWEVITRSLAAYLAEASPEMAISLRSTEPTALLNLAEDRLNLDAAATEVEPVSTPPRNEASDSRSELKSDQSTQVLDRAGGSPSPSPQGNPLRVAGGNSEAQIRAWAERALLNDPLNARAFRILGQVSQSSSDEERTEALMQAAARRSLFESVAVYWMIRKSYQDHDYAAALHYADTLMRTRPQLLQYVMPMLGKMAEMPDGSYELKQILAGNPPWRPQFFASLPASISDARTPLDILLTLKDTATPPTTVDLRSYLDFLINHGFHELAYYTWLQFLPPEQFSKAGHLLDGSFEVAPSGLPFDWVFNQGPGVTIQIAARPDQDGEHALFMEFGPGRVETFGVKQMTLLEPGNYKFRGKYKADLVSERGLEWRITCAGEPASQIGQSPAVTGSTPAWTDFEFSFAVPNADCPAQNVSLALDARSASEQFVSGSIWYDDLEIIREPIVDSRSEQ